MAIWTLDPGHTTAEFSARHLMVTTVRGRFAPPTGTIDFDPANPSAATVEATIDATTLTSGLADRDGHLKSPDFLDVANFPNITFKSTNVAVTGEGTANVTGDLTIRGVTKPITLAVEFTGTAKDPWGGTRAGFTAETKINREDWGLTWNVALEAGGVLVGKDIKLTIDAEAVLQAVPEAAATA
ncbi:MAG: YceI family protein [Chloroflexota bacterium]|nr:YceI family protein [Chloroflexota bacterium]